jgi:dihydrofolate synthase/folylpolyglutamate synthase
MGKEVNMNYTETVDYIFSQLPMFQRTGPAAYKANLDNTIALDEHFHHPHQNFKSVHIAGTNGKGSVSHMLAAILQSSGYKTGLYTSPHLIDFRERIRVNGVMISEDFVCRFVEENMEFINKISPSFFELTTLMAFRYFADSNVDIAVIETGMGGRLDSTNIIHPLVSVITNIGLDHTQFLGNSLEQVAAEKAGIIKENVPVVIGEKQKETDEVFKSFTNRLHSKLYFASEKYSVDTTFLSPDRKQQLFVKSSGKLVYENLHLDLLGLYQKKNVPTVLQTIDCLREREITIPGESVLLALKNVRKITGLRGRWDEVGYNPLIICDTGHNAEGIAEVVEQISHTAYKKLHIIFGTVSDKDASKVLALLPIDAVYYFTKADIPRALEPALLMQQAQTFGLKGELFPGVKEAFESAISSANKEDLIFIGGSTFVVADFLKYRSTGI